MLAYFSTSFGAYHRCLDIPPFLWRCLPTALNSRSNSGYRARRCGFFTPCQECFSPWEWSIIQPVFGPGVHPLYKTRKGKVYGPHC